jgi:hypothetical protein
VWIALYHQRFRLGIFWAVYDFKTKIYLTPLQIGSILQVFIGQKGLTSQNLGQVARRVTDVKHPP